MSTRSSLSRITIDIPKEDHRKLKAKAAILGKSMREIILEALEVIDECIECDHYPNKKTVKVIKDAENAKGLVKGKKLAVISKKLGI